MPGIATHFVVLDQVINRLALSGDAAQANIGAALRAQPIYANLGALGPDLLDFMPNSLVVGQLGASGSGLSPFAAFWQITYGLATGNSTTPSLVSTLATLKSLLSQLGQIANNEDLGALQSFRSDGRQHQALAAMNDCSAPKSS